MAQEYRYPLTRICLRSGALTLPRTMLGLFPEQGAITAVDSESGEEFQLEAAGPRTITGVGGFFEAHELDVNDEVLIRPLEDGRFAFTALRRARRRDFAGPGAVKALLDELVHAELAATEGEIRALYPQLPEDFDLRGMLEADERFVHFEGRWHARAALERRLDDEAAARAGAAPRRGRPGAAPAGAVRAQEIAAGAAQAEEGHGGRAQAPEARAGQAAAREGATGPGSAPPEPPYPDTHRPELARPELARLEQARLEQARLEQAPAEPARAELRPLEAGESQQEALWRSTWQEPRAPEEDAPRSARPPQAVGDTASEVPEAGSEAEQRTSAASVRERRAPRAVFPGDAALSREDAEDAEEADLEHVSQARELLQSFGFRVEALGQSALMVHAELGRRGYTVLVHVLSYGQRLDWAALLARRREVGARYLAVFGDRRDLVRLQSPAELARATLWSWEGLHRARSLSRSVPISPFDLELHFEREGLSGHGLERFEGDVAELVAQRGAFSQVLTSLAGLRAPTVFLLEDLAAEGTLSRDAVLRVLERLVEAPFHMVARVAQGEFCLRRPVAEGLGNLADYATSMRERLPNRGRERLTGLGEPELLQEEELFREAGGARREDSEGREVGADDPHDESDDAEGSDEGGDPPTRG